MGDTLRGGGSTSRRTPGPRDVRQAWRLRSSSRSRRASSRLAVENAISRPYVSHGPLFEADTGGEPEISVLAPLAMLRSNKRIRQQGKTQGPGELPYPQSPTADAEYHKIVLVVSEHRASVHVLLRAHPCPGRSEGDAFSTLRVDYRVHSGDGPRFKTRRIAAVPLPLPAATASGRVRTRSTSRTLPGRTRRRPWPTR